MKLTDETDIQLKCSIWKLPVATEPEFFLFVFSGCSNLASLS